MAEIDHIAYAKWEGAAQAFCNSVRKAHGLMITKHPQQALSIYGDKGYKPFYSDYLERIDSIIAILEHSRSLFLEAESLRKQVERDT